MFAAAITSTVFIFSSREYDDRITSYVGGDGLEADVVVLPDGIARLFCQEKDILK